ncbi:hypothetical protein [Phenylobacterium sp.]|jgi:DNA-binding Lrp family transcriptional regulator|uniref:hypothetical protein n=1 Tax=Phenylobacterium sp. TaxID=1871053 RepID=UPI002F9299B8
MDAGDEGLIEAVGRHTVVFVHDVANISRGGGHALDTLVLVATVQANQAAVRRDPKLQRRFGAPGTVLPDSLRRPISIHALAQSLGLPFETVRRRARTLVAADLCRIAAGGLIVPEAVVTSSWYAARQAERVDRLRGFLELLDRVGAVAATPDLGGFLAENARAADRLLGDYMLRACDRLLRLAGNAQDGLVLLALWAEGVRRLDPCGAAGPVSGGGLGRSLGMPAETARRRLRALAALGFACFDDAGWRAAWPADRAADVRAVRTESLPDLRRLLAGLEAVRRAVPSRPAPGLVRA